jgi:hypothetical protein
MEKTNGLSGIEADVLQKVWLGNYSQTGIARASSVQPALVRDTLICLNCHVPPLVYWRQIDNVTAGWVVTEAGAGMANDLAYGTPCLPTLPIFSPSTFQEEMEQEKEGETRRKLWQSIGGWLAARLRAFGAGLSWGIPVGLGVVYLLVLGGLLLRGNLGERHTINLPAASLPSAILSPLVIDLANNSQHEGAATDPCAVVFHGTGNASFYGKGDGFDGEKTASGETFNARALTAAMHVVPFGSVALVRNLDTGLSVAVRINDRGPYRRAQWRGRDVWRRHPDRIIDLSAEAARLLGMDVAGVARVEVVVSFCPEGVPTNEEEGMD